MIETRDSELANKIIEIRRRGLNKFRKDFKEKPVKYWLEKDRFLNKIGTSLVVILATRGCNWALSSGGGCSMCGYIYDSPISLPDSKSLINQFDLAFKASIPVKSPLAVKIFTSGSFFDECEVPKSAREEILKKIVTDKRVEEIIVETRPEYVTHEILHECCEILGEIHFEIAIGLETSNDNIRRNYINKGFELKDFERAVSIAKNHGVSVKSYLLVKPPFLREREAIIDSTISAFDCLKMGINSVSFNPCTVQKGTLVEYLWKLGKYRPPWLWSILEILKNTSEKLNNKIRIICSLVGVGSKKGPHNCGKCDAIIREKLNEFTLTQNPEILSNVECGCKQEWLDYCETEFICDQNFNE